MLRQNNAFSPTSTCVHICARTRLSLTNRTNSITAQLACQTDGGSTFFVAMSFNAQNLLCGLFSRCQYMKDGKASKQTHKVFARTAKSSKPKSFCIDGMYRLRLVLLWSLFLAGSVAGYRQVVEPKEKLTTSEEPKPWVRTIYGTKVEIVTPSVIAGVTFAAKPAATPDPLEPWISLKKDGTPQTIRPDVKNGRTRKASPDYSTYFQTISTRTYSYEELKAHNMDPNDVHEEEILIDEDKTYLSLNPIIRCTPERYFNKGKAKNVISAPFCTPHENVELKVGKTYFTTWYTRFFQDENSDEHVDKVRLHLSYVEESAKEKGNHRKRSTSVTPATFYSSEWLDNTDGIYPLEINEEWLDGEYERKVVLSLQPSNVEEEDFDPLENGVMLYIIMGSRVFKTSKEQLALEAAGLAGRKWFYVALTMPTVVVIAVVLMYFFLRANSKYRDFSSVTNKALNKRRRVIGKLSDMKKFKNMKNHKYSELPSFEMKSSKQH